MFGFNYLGSASYASILDLYILYATKAVLIDNKWVDCVVYVFRDGQWTQSTVEVLLENKWDETVG